MSTMAISDAQLLHPRAALQGEGRRRPQKMVTAPTSTTTINTSDTQNKALRSSHSFPMIQNKPLPRSRSNSWNNNIQPPPSVLRKQHPLPRKPNRRYTMPYPTTSATTNSTSELPITSQLERRHSYIPAISSPLNPSEKVRAGGSADDIAVASATTSKSSGSSDAINRTISSENTNSSYNNNSQSSNSDPRLSNISGTAGSSLEKLGAISTKKRASGKLRKNVPSTAASYQIPNTQYSVESLHNLGKDYDRYPRYGHQNQHSTKGRQEGDRLLEPGQQNQQETQPKDAEKEFSPYLDDSIGSKSPFVAGAFPMYFDEKEDDDYLHDPDPLYDRHERAPLWRNLGFRGFVNVFCFFFFFLGLVIVFIVVPVVTFATKNIGSNYYTPPPVNDWSTVNHDSYPNIKRLRTNMVDPDTPKSAYTRKSVNGGDLKLVFSDEFNEDGRTFYAGDDQFWQAVNLNYHATGDMEWYDEDAVTTKGGTLRLQLDKFPNHDLDYRSGMLQSWNKLCFKGGVLEVSVSLPGPAGVPGLWPGIWTLGNLARPGYSATSEGLWPYSYNDCDVGITPNQSSSDGLSFLPGQKLNSCTCKGESHPNPGVGRGAPEIDVFEASANGELKLGVVTQSLQVAPFDIFYQPNYDFIAIHNRSVTAMNGYKGGVYQQAISGVTTLNPRWYDGKEYQKYAFEYETKEKNNKKNPEGFITWFVGDEPTFTLRGETTGQNGNVKKRDISLEPMSIILNLGFSHGWTYIDYQNLEFPTTMYIDYVRIYQEEGSESLTCDPQGFPTTQYIEDHWKAYQIWNYTIWRDTGYEWPKNRLMNDCK